MQPHPPLETIAQRLAEQLRCEQEDLCLPILQQVSRGKFLTKAELGAELQLDQDELERRLMQLPGTPLFTWCAFDTVLFPLSLGAPAHVQSTCPVTGHPIKFVVTPEGNVQDLHPAGSVLSLIIPAERRDCVRATFCQHSLFFESEQAASIWLTAHPVAVVLSIEDAAFVGRLVAETRFTKLLRTFRLQH